MKKLWLPLMLCLLLLSGCGASANSPQADASADPTISLRIVDGADTGQLVLAGETAAEVYTLATAELPVYLDGALADASVLEDGMQAQISYSGLTLETYPLQLDKVSSIAVNAHGTQQNPYGTFYDLCGLYLQVLNDLWEKDSGLNDGVAYVSVDLSRAPGDLTAGEQSAIAWIFANTHQAEGLSLSREQLLEQGYLTPVPGMTDTQKGSAPTHWEDGVLFGITPSSEKQTEQSSQPTLQFDAQKWRSPLGAYFFSNCTATWPQQGAWESYTVEAEMIS